MHFIYIYSDGNRMKSVQMTVEFVILVVALVVIALVFASTVITGSSPMPTSPRVRRTMMAVLPERLPGAPNAQIYELGSGWGGMAFALARRYPRHSVTGFEISPLPWLAARLRLAVNPRANLRFRWVNFYKVDLSDAGLVVCYLFPSAMQTLALKFEHELEPGTLVLSNTFAIRAWRPVDEMTAKDQYASKVYLYEAGEQAREPG